MGLPIKLSPLAAVADYGIELQLKSGKKDVVIETLSTTKNREQMLQTVVEVYEYQALYLSFTDHHKNRELTIKLPSMDTNGTMDLSLSGNQWHALYDPMKHAAFPWRCGMLIYQIELAGNTFYGAINVIPNNLSTAQHREMAAAIEQAFAGLTLDYFNGRKQFYTPQEGLGHHQLHFLQWLQQSFSKLLHALHWIEKESQMQVKRHYQLQSHPGRFDRHSIKRENSFQGALIGENHFYNRKQNQSINLPENQLVKYQAKQILRQIDLLQARITADVNRLKASLNKEEKALQHAATHLLTLMDPKVTKKDQQLQQNHVYGRKMEYQRAAGQEEKTSSLHRTVIQYKQQLQHLLKQPFWMQIDDIPPAVPVRKMQQGYVLFHKLWKEFHGQKHGLQTEKQAITEGVLLHPTSKLYEYYAYILVIGQLRKKGYTPKEDSLIQQLQQGSLHGQLQQGTKVVLANEQSEIQLIYDKEVEHRSQQAIANGTYFFSKFSKKQPDIRIDLYRKKNEQLLYDSSVVVEVKYRPFQNIYSDAGNTKAMEQMNEYIGIKHYCPVRKQYLNRIRDVLCFYPGNKHKPFCLSTEAGKFIQLYPDGETTAGLEAVNQILDDWLAPVL